jgi:hypothetical protein
MKEERRKMTWKEQGVGNWARDCGFVMTKEDDRYNLWGLNTQSRVLNRVELNEVEQYLDAL